jgi:hypothetical protein
VFSLAISLIQKKRRPCHTGRFFLSGDVGKLDGCPGIPLALGERGLDRLSQKWGKNKYLIPDFGSFASSMPNL